MDIKLTLANRNISEEDLFSLTSDLQQTINNETSVNAESPKTEAQLGKKGDPITIGTLLLTFISSGAAVAFFKVIKSYFERDESLELTFSKPDGTTITIKSSNLETIKNWVCFGS